MAINKSTNFGEKEQKAANFAKILSHPARIEILKTLAEKNSCICGEIVEVMPLSQSTVSQHLKELKDAGIIEGTINGPKSCYYINWENLEKNIQLINDMMNELKYKKESACCVTIDVCKINSEENK